MKWKDLETLIPATRVRVGTEELHVDQVTIFDSDVWSIQVAQPGKYWDKTTPPGGDFVVRVASRRARWNKRPFTHDELFEDVEEKTLFRPLWARRILMPALATVVVCGAAPEAFDRIERDDAPGLETAALLTASQCLALAESRRFAYMEKSGGGRYLPGEFALGIADTRWTAADAAAPQKVGIDGVRSLLRSHGGKLGDFRKLALCDEI
jgi:hypothetical protein